MGQWYCSRKTSMTIKKPNIIEHCFPFSRAIQQNNCFQQVKINFFGSLKELKQYCLSIIGQFGNYSDIRIFRYPTFSILIEFSRENFMSNFMKCPGGIIWIFNKIMLNFLHSSNLGIGTSTNTDKLVDVTHHQINFLLF